MAQSSVLRVLLLVLMAAVWSGCATQRPAEESVVPGTIGVAVARTSTGIAVAALGREGPAARADVRVGDIVVSYNGTAISTARQFQRLIVDSKPGTIVRLELRRSGKSLLVDVRVGELRISQTG
jgi:S1-C subfamily serine protease